MGMFASLLATASSSLTSLSTSVKADGVVDNSEVTALENEIYDDGTVETAEIAVLFDIADNTTYSGDFANLVSKAVRDWGYADGELDNTEAMQLRTFIEADGTYSDLEIRILAEVLSSGATMPSDFKSWAQSVVSTN